jgi:hypothetical protein
MSVLTMSPNDLNLCNGTSSHGQSVCYQPLLDTPVDENADGDSLTWAIREPQLELNLEHDNNNSDHQSNISEINIQPTRNHSSSNEKKTVRFCLLSTKVYKHIHRNEITPGEKASAWLTFLNMCEIKADIFSARAKFSRGTWTHDTNQYSQRGIGMRNQPRILFARSVVLDEQQRQRAEGILDPMRIHSKYRDACRESIVESQEQGIKDFEELFLMERNS